MNSNIVKTINYIKRNGFSKGYYAILERVLEKGAEKYQYTPLSDEERNSQKAEADNYNIGISILVPAYETKPEYMRALIKSVLNQTYENWELVIADASGTEIVKSTVNEFDDSRIKYIKLSKNEGISDNTNEGLKYCSKEYTGLLDHDDLLTEDALYEMVEKISASRKEGIELKFVYSDEDKTNAENTRYFESNTKPKFNLDLILSNNYICHFLVIETAFLNKIGFRKEYDGAQDHDLILSMVSKLEDEFGDDFYSHIGNINKVLYHWRCHEASTAANPESKAYAYDAGKRAIEDYYERNNINAKVMKLPHLGFFYTEYIPDIFSNRSNVAAVGGRIVDKNNKVIGGCFDADKCVMYEGINYHFSGGYLHRMACQQEVPYVDIAYMKTSKECQELLEEFIAKRGIDLKDKSAMSSLSFEFCDMMKEKGYIFVYDPQNIYRK